jgi:hypothetical protein
LIQINTSTSPSTRWCGLVSYKKRLRNLMSGNSECHCSVMISFPRDVWLIGGLPFVVDFDMNGSYADDGPG